MMPTTTRTANSETRKNAATTSSKSPNPSIRPSITGQEPPSPSRDAKTPPASTDDGKKFFYRDTTTTSPTKTPSTNAPIEAEQMMFQALKQLQKIYDASCKTKTNKITIERATFEKMATIRGYVCSFLQQIVKNCASCAQRFTSAPRTEGHDDRT